MAPRENRKREAIDETVLEGGVSGDCCVNRIPDDDPTLIDSPSVYASDARTDTETAPLVIGPYTTLEILGEGGMGTVYLADQSRPIKRQVALKLIRTRARDPHILQRFEAERQALARMNDPHIARVLEAGETEDGLPFIVMEYVPGKPITTACDEAELGVDERLQLFADVCRGIHHAHQKGVLHRDIKPSNILATEVDGRLLPKIIDFGIAKALDDPLTDATLLTQHGTVFGTPSYLSPETIEKAEDRADVDIRSDVYSLGVLLYELLTGQLPHGAAGDSVLAIINKVTQDDIRAPSACFRSLDAETAEERAAQRSTTSQAFARRLRGDLDWIVLKATSRDRHDRYESAAELAAEIDRHQNDQPVVAGPPGRAYRAKKFLRRHKVGVAAIVFAAIALGGGFAARTIEAQRANREAASARQAQLESDAVVDFLVDLFQLSDPGEARGNNITAREILDRGADRIASELRDQPLTRARLLDTIGLVYRELGLFDPAANLLQQALELRLDRQDDAPLDLAETQHRLAMVYWQQGHYDEADELLESALQTREHLLNEDHLLVSHTLNDLASSYRIRGRTDEAEALYRRALTIREQRLQPDDPVVADTVHNIAVLCFDSGRTDDARPLFERALAIRKKAWGMEHPEVAHSANGLAMVCSMAGEHDRAERLFRQTLAIRENVLGPNHADVAQSLNNLASDLLDQNRRDEALPLIERAIQIYETTLGPDHYRVGIGLNNLADLHRESGQSAEAEPLYRRALTIFETALSPGHINVSFPVKGLADLCRDTGRIQEADTFYRRTLVIRESNLAEDHEMVVDTRADYDEFLKNSS